MVHAWPVAGTHWRSSAQIAHTAGRSACSTAHVRQIHQPASGVGAGEGAGVVVMAQVYRAPPTRVS